MYKGCETRKFEIHKIPWNVLGLLAWKNRKRLKACWTHADTSPVVWPSPYACAQPCRPGKVWNPALSSVFYASDRDSSWDDFIFIAGLFLFARKWVALSLLHRSVISYVKWWDQFLFFPSVFEGRRFKLMLLILHLSSSSFVSPFAQRLNKIYSLAVFSAKVLAWTLQRDFHHLVFLLDSRALIFWKPTTFFQWTVSFKRGVSESSMGQGVRAQPSGFACGCYWFKSLHLSYSDGLISVQWPKIQLDHPF